MRKLFIFSVILILTFGCSELELPSKSYPYVVMNEVKTVDEGVEFVAGFKSLGETSIKRYGFLWWQGSAMDSSDFYIKEIESEAVIGTFSLNVTSDLEKGIVYYVRPFAENANKMVLGNVMSFESSGTLPPEIKDFIPKSGGPGDLITISGSHFSLSSTRIEVYLGTDKGILVSNEENEIKFTIPEHLSKSGEVPLSVKSGGTTVQANDPFLLKGHQVTGFSPNEGIIGETEITITGNGFLNSGNIVRIGGYEAVVLNESESTLKVKLPYDMKVGMALLEVVCNGQAATANDMFTIRSRWVKLANFPGTPRLDAFYTVVGDFLYVIGGETGVYSDEVWKYDIFHDRWEQLPNFPGGGRAGGVGFAIGNSIYYGLGAGSGDTKDFWSYNILTGEWRQTFSLGSVDYPLYTSFNGKGYLLAGWSNGVESFTQASGWSYLGWPPDYLDVSSVYDNYFEAGGNSYVFDLNRDGSTGETYGNLYKVDRENPIAWEFVLRMPFARKSYNGICFALDNAAYIGEGAVEHKDREFFKLDVPAKTWIQIENFQGPPVIRGAISFSHNNKGYVGLGLVRSPEAFYSSNEFWMYDPSL